MTAQFLRAPYDDRAGYSGCEVEDVEGADGSASH
jgi:hypothetical protein